MPVQVEERIDLSGIHTWYELYLRCPLEEVTVNGVVDKLWATEGQQGYIFRHKGFVEGTYFVAFLKVNYRIKCDNITMTISCEVASTVTWETLIQRSPVVDCYITGPGCETTHIDDLHFMPDDDEICMIFMHGSFSDGQVEVPMDLLNNKVSDWGYEFYVQEEYQTTPWKDLGALLDEQHVWISHSRIKWLWLRNLISGWPLTEVEAKATLRVHDDENHQFWVFAHPGLPNGEVHVPYDAGEFMPAGMDCGVQIWRDVVILS